AGGVGTGAAAGDRAGGVGSAAAGDGAGGVGAGSAARAGAGAASAVGTVVVVAAATRAAGSASAPARIGPAARPACRAKNDRAARSFRREFPTRTGIKQVPPGYHPLRRPPRVAWFDALRRAKLGPYIQACQGLSGARPAGIISVIRRRRFTETPGISEGISRDTHFQE